MESVQLGEIERLAEEELGALAGRGNKILLRAKLRRFDERSRKQALQMAKLRAPPQESQSDRVSSDTSDDEIRERSEMEFGASHRDDEAHKSGKVGKEEMDFPVGVPGT